MPIGQATHYYNTARRYASMLNAIARRYRTGIDPPPRGKYPEVLRERRDSIIPFLRDWSATRRPVGRSYTGSLPDRYDHVLSTIRSSQSTPAPHPDWFYGVHLMHLTGDNYLWSTVSPPIVRAYFLRGLGYTTVFLVVSASTYWQRPWFVIQLKWLGATVCLYVVVD